MAFNLEKFAEEMLKDAFKCIKRADKSNDVNVLQQAINDRLWINGADAPVKYNELTMYWNADCTDIIKRLPDSTELSRLLERYEANK